MREGNGTNGLEPRGIKKKKWKDVKSKKAKKEKKKKKKKKKRKKEREKEETKVNQRRNKMTFGGREREGGMNCDNGER